MALTVWSLTLLDAPTHPPRFLIFVIGASVGRSLYRFAEPRTKCRADMHRGAPVGDGGAITKRLVTRGGSTIWAASSNPQIICSTIREKLYPSQLCRITFVSRVFVPASSEGAPREKPHRFSIRRGSSIADGDAHPYGDCGPVTRRQESTGGRA